MKYPQQQFEVLTEGLKKLAVHFDIKSVNPHALHFMIYQQYSEGQQHNWLYCYNGEIRKAHKIEDITNWVKFFEGSYNFDLYPEGCNDSHIETAMKQAIKNLTNV